jgi:aryl-alcohol dehydrogenase-like predicted oxidoreductase
VSEASRRAWLQQAGALGAALALPPWAAGAPANPPLLTRRIPSTGVAIPVVGVGTNRYRTGDAAYEARLRETLQAFAQLGGQVVDTAPSYGDSEQAIGGILSATKIRERLFVATKVDRDDVAEGRARIEASFATLGVNTLDLLQLHSLRGAVTMLPVLRELKAAGRVRHIGVTTSSDHQYAELEALMRRESFDFVQLDYAVGNRGAAARLLPLAADRGMAVLVNLPFGRGAQFRAVGGRPLPPWAAEIDCASWAQVFLKYVIAHPAVTCAIPGTTQVAHVHDNLGAARGRLPDAAMRRTIEAYFDAIADA